MCSCGILGYYVWAVTALARVGNLSTPIEKFLPSFLYPKLIIKVQDLYFLVAAGDVDGIVVVLVVFQLCDWGFGGTVHRSGFKILRKGKSKTFLQIYSTAWQLSGRIFMSPSLLSKHEH